MSEVASISATSAQVAPASAADTGNSSVAVNYETAMAVDPNAPQTPPPSLLNSPWFLVIIAAVWILFLWASRRSSKKQEQKRREELNAISKGDRVVTIGRMHGVVTAMTDKTFTVKPDPNKDYVMMFDREALLRVENKKDAPKTVEGAEAIGGGK
jgi:preprotein translocase subunit YajC